MPSKSVAQARTMAAIAHGWKPKNAGLSRIPVKVANEFNNADQEGHDDEKKKRRMMAHMLMKG